MSDVYYNPQDVADQLKVSKPTLRRWANQLETNGLVIYRDKHDRRIYSEQNVEALKSFKKRLDNGDDVISAVNVVVSTFNEKKKSSRALSDHEENPIIERSSTNMSAIEENMVKMVKVIESLTNEVNNLRQEVREQKEVSNIQLQRHDQLLLEHIRQIQEAKEIAVTKEESSKKWWRFWKS